MEIIGLRLKLILVIVMIAVAAYYIGGFVSNPMKNGDQDSPGTYIAAAQFHSGQTRCWNAFGTEITCTGTGQDADVDGTSKSYTDNGCGTSTVLDNHTNLCWQKDDQDARTWEDALSYCNDLSLGGHSDWHLPTRLEGVTMLDYSCDSGTPVRCYGDFRNNALIWDSAGDTGPGLFWLSTTSPVSPPYAYYLHFRIGLVSLNTKINSYYVRCVRGQ